MKIHMLIEQSKYLKIKFCPNSSSSFAELLVSRDINIAISHFPDFERILKWEFISFKCKVSTIIW